ncbi:hypothetical protein M513_10179 [Trichuris suis]|uniref:Uncharacterized protein n=1 Tax=Trichuris suis TaxID=68888 RepID=A0A085LVE2_9BILA|nr:hypothetical protein M513_10179 [Trichuris suis]
MGVRSKERHVGSDSTAMREPDLWTSVRTWNQRPGTKTARIRISIGPAACFPVIGLSDGSRAWRPWEREG